MAQSHEHPKLCNSASDYRKYELSEDWTETASTAFEYSTLHIVTDHPASPATCGHRASIRIGQRYLLVLGLHHLSVQSVQALYVLTQRRNLLVEPGDLGLRHRFPLAIGAVELREIAGYALIN